MLENWISRSSYHKVSKLYEWTIINQDIREAIVKLNAEQTRLIRKSIYNYTLLTIEPNIINLFDDSFLNLVYSTLPNKLNIRFISL